MKTIRPEFGCPEILDCGPVICMYMPTLTFVMTLVGHAT